ncbi:hypothetical protein [Ligilactobacillus salivarius]|uniref:hypothetical protein n=1 Tax=Ligilactobacillus salivarius TaxID=1624 RepID=UPI0016525205|nr:hypothetical protein [Ligilactobacillus salivarius]MBC6925043.1 hypothetical protein [Ligilactobacillus salivarius]MBC6925047.1 hypothetical protein [Ligilactobacillus salivarius]
MLSIHFDGVASLYSELKSVNTDISTAWLKLTDKPRTSKVRLNNGKLEYVKCNGKALKPRVRIRSKNDSKHRNSYIAYSHYYMHRLTAMVAYNELNKSLDGLEVHHRLMDATATIQGNSIQYLAVLTYEEHDRLHYLLRLITDYVSDIISGQVNLLDYGLLA